MADKKSLLTPLKKRDVLFSNSVPDEEKAEWGRRYLEQGRIMDALDFFTEAKSRPDLEDIRRRAIESGDAFILRTISKTLPELVNQEHWQALEKNAQARGKDAFAEQGGRGGEVEMAVVDAVIRDDPTEHEGGEVDGSEEEHDESEVERGEEGE